MHAALLRRFGGPEVLQIEDIPAPQPGPGELQIKVHAVSINRSFDLLVRADNHNNQYEIKLPMVLGMDPSGTVTAVGESISRFKIGDRVSATLNVTRSGGDAEYCVVPERSAVPIPDGVSFADATVITRHYPQAFGLAYAAELRAGDFLLVMGAAGGLGSCAVQVGKVLGAKVIAGAGADERVKAAMDLGADFGVNYRTKDLADEVKRLTEGHGADVVFENIADPTLWPGAFYSMAVGGRLVTVGAHGGGTVPLDVRALYHRRLKIMSGTGSTRPEDFDRSLQMAAAGKLKVLIDRVLPLSAVQEAHRLAESNQVTGKIILDPTLG
jgi:NADPH2:quinone reductase